MRLDVLGALAITVDGSTQEVELSSKRARLLLASLALTDGPTPRSVLYQRLWLPDWTELQRSGNEHLRRSLNGRLNVETSKARAVLGGERGRGPAIRSDTGNSGLILDRPGTPALEARATVSTDYDEVRRVAETNLANKLDPEEMEVALMLVRGPLLGSFDGHEFGWLADARTTVEETLVEAVRRCTGWPHKTVKPIVAGYLARPSGTLLDAVQREQLVIQTSPHRAAPGDTATADVPSRSAPSGQDGTTNDPSPTPTRQKSEDAESDSDGPDDGPPKRGARSLPRWAAITGAAALVVALVVALALTGPLDDHANGPVAKPSPVLDKSPDAPPAGRGPETPPADLVLQPSKALAVGVRALNRTIDRRWGTRIRADPNDKLTIALTIKNHLKKRTPPLSVWIQITGGEKRPEFKRHGRPARLLIHDDSGTVWATTPWLAFDSWTNQMYRFTTPIGSEGQDASAQDLESGRVRRLAQDTGGTIPADLSSAGDLGGPIDIGVVDPGKTLLVRFPANWTYFPTYDFGGVPPTFRVLGGNPKQWVNSGAVDVGDTIKVFQLLDNQSNIPAYGKIRVRFRKKDDGSYVQMTTYGALNDHRRAIGKMTISSRSGAPIAVLPRPGTTVLRTARRTVPCHKHGPDKRLEDGIAQGGIDIGVFGGFTPHSNCAGVDPNRYLFFDATIVPAK